MHSVGVTLACAEAIAKIISSDGPTRTRLDSYGHDDDSCFAELWLSD